MLGEEGERLCQLVCEFITQLVDGRTVIGSNIGQSYGYVRGGSLEFHHVIVDVDADADGYHVRSRALYENAGKFVSAD